MKRKVIAVFTACIISVSLLSACGHQNDEPAGGQGNETPDWSVASPDNSLSVDISLDNGQLYFWVEKDDSTAVKKSMLGISTDTNLFNDLTFIQSDSEEKTINYTNITGKKKDVTTSFNGTTLTFSEGDFYLDAEFRAYNDGYAFRYGIRHVNDETGTFTIEDENTHFVLPDDAKTYGMKYVSNSGVLGNGEYYALKIEGDSMIEAGILNGDTVIIKKADTAQNGDIVVALVDNSEATLKQIKKDGTDVLLIPKNEAYETRRFPATRVKVQGILSSLIRTYH